MVMKIWLRVRDVPYETNQHIIHLNSVEWITITKGCVEINFKSGKMFFIDKELFFRATFDDDTDGEMSYHAFIFNLEKYYSYLFKGERLCQNS